jgi:hypothetical protein
MYLGLRLGVFKIILISTIMNFFFSPINISMVEPGTQYIFV